MGSEHDAAFERIVFDDVVNQDIVAAFCGLIADQYAVGIAGNQIGGHQRVNGSDEMNGTAAVAALVGLIGGLAVASRAGAEDGAFLVVIDDRIVSDGDVGRADHQDAFVQSILHGEACDGHIVKAGMIKAVHQDAIGETRCVDDGGMVVGADERERFPDVDVFFISAGGDIDDIKIGSCVYRGLNLGVTRRGTVGFYAQGLRC